MHPVTRLSLLLAFWTAGPAALAAEPLPGRLPAGVIPVHYEISVAPDARALTFTGRTAIDVDVQAPADTITLNALDLDIASAHADGAREAVVELDPRTECATLHFRDPLAAGRHRLTFEYRGRIDTNPAGLFAVDYDTTTGPRLRDPTARAVGTSPDRCTWWRACGVRPVASMAAVTAADVPW